MLRPSHRSFAWLSEDILSRLLVIDLQAGKFRTIPAMKYRPAVFSVNDQVPDTRQSGSRRVSKSTTRTLDFEESDTPGGLLNGNTCHKSMRGKLHRGSVWEK